MLASQGFHASFGTAAAGTAAPPGAPTPADPPENAASVAAARPGPTAPELAGTASMAPSAAAPAAMTATAARRRPCPGRPAWPARAPAGDPPRARSRGQLWGSGTIGPFDRPRQRVLVCGSSSLPSNSFLPDGPGWGTCTGIAVIA